jgi:hypothetical protein
MAATAQALRAIADELDILRQHVHSLAPVVAAGVTAEPAHIADAQRVDLMAQSLAAIASLARDLSQGQHVDHAVSRIALADLASRLASAIGGDKIRGAVLHPDMELF